MNLKHILWYLGVFLILNGILLLIPIPIAILYNEPILPFLVGGASSWLFGAILMRFPKSELEFGDTMLLVALGLIILSLFASLPLLFETERFDMDSIINCYFDSISGYTTAGFTTMSNEMLNPNSEKYKYSIIFLRTLREWIGGLGIIVIFLSTLARGGISTVYLYRMEHGDRKILPSVEHTARFILRMYIFYTFVGTVVLWLLGTSLFYAITGTMSMLATGGFIINDLGFHVNKESELVLLLIMTIGAIPFTLGYVLLSGNIKRFLCNLEIRTAFVVSLFSVFIFTVLLMINGNDVITSIYKSTVGVISAMSTSGYSSANLEDLGDAGKFLLILLMIIGAGAGSTGGGLKWIRLGVLVKAVRWIIRKSSLPESAVLPLKIDGRIFDDQDLRFISLFFFIYIALIAIGSLIFLIYNPEYELVDALLISSSIQSNVGINLGINITDQPIIVKLIFIFQMIAGRIEIFPVLALIGYIIGEFKREIKYVENELEHRR
ncbi:MAG: hypothetical protein DRO90_01160 [Candidatus Altiarchaeales archaeon]|nr:MAG: hypothetical protein DRO95_02810 [Candidatus Altiarchaeales archaeon]RLI94870.1 MAG: hypothetical protein DRO94_01885 [Candidatus Altiarchaeales archaeon]RLI94971.1 MAG: hypothetical protein DRO90_01160 [Candidatus Altiarchaeales archaeon]HDO82088.1 TrkH family potassium uptake protein [Candidatus Altiarchaeales archaeon]HEX54737.1 TrkH family potassium uptake protein [Candidatus Altiarchaeales archaeon]